MKWTNVNKEKKTKNNEGKENPRNVKGTYLKSITLNITEQNNFWKHMVYYGITTYT